MLIMRCCRWDGRLRGWSMQAWHRDGCESCGQGQDASAWPCTYCTPPVLVPSNWKTRPSQHMSGVERAVNNNTTRNRGGFCHGDDQDQQQLSIGSSIRPGTTAPPAVLVTDMSDGSSRLQGRDDGPNAYLNPPDVEPLKRKPAAAFGSTELALRGGHGEAR
jgi:hypothetical protein